MIWALALHGGAGAIAEHAYRQEEEHMAGLLEDGAAMLARGDSALDVVTAMAEALEACGLHQAGKGSAPNLNGEVELDASVMEGETRAAGAVAALRGFLSPVRVARGVMEKTSHVLLAGDGADAFASANGFARVEDPKSYYRTAASGLAGVGTIGAVARDTRGRLAAATSTGGIQGKMPGRVGDYADHWRGVLGGPARSRFVHRAWRILYARQCGGGCFGADRLRGRNIG